MKNKKSSDIAIRDALFYVLSHWFLLALVCIICAGGMTLYSMKKSVSETKQMAVADNPKLDKKVKILEGFYRERDELIIFTNDSTIMKINPSKTYQENLKYYISVKGVDDSDSILTALLEAYRSSVYTDSFFEKIKDEFGNQKQYIGDLIKTEKIVSNGYGEVVMSDSDSEHGMTLNIYLTAGDSEELSNISQAVKAEINLKYTELNDTFKKHSIQLVSDTTPTVMDTDVLNTQMNILNQLRDLDNKITDIESKMSASDMLYINNKINGNENNTSIEKSQIKFKYVLAGAIGGLLIASFLLIINYSFNKKLTSIQSIRNDYDKETYAIKGKKHAAFSKMRYSNEHLYASEELAELISAEIGVENKSLRIYVSSTCYTDMSKEIADSMATELKKHGFIVDIGEKVKYTPSEILKIKKADYIFNIEQIGESSNFEIGEFFAFAENKCNGTLLNIVIV